MEEKTITLNLKKYRIKGIVKFKDWYNGICFIDMKSVDFDNKPSVLDIEQNLNDGGFGAQVILGGYINLFEVYDNNVEIMLEDSMFIKDFTEDDLSVVL